MPAKRKINKALEQPQQADGLDDMFASNVSNSDYYTSKTTDSTIFNTANNTKCAICNEEYNNSIMHFTLNAKNCVS